MKKRFFFALLIFVGSLLCYLSYKEYQRETTLASSGLVVHAEVVENVMHGKFYHPILSYNYNNVDYKVEAFNSGANPALYSVGDQVTAYIKAENPSEVEIKTAFNQILKPFILLLLGMLCLYSAFKVLRMEKI